MPFRPVCNRTPGQGAMTGRRRGPRPRRAVFAATVTRASVRLAPAAILLSARQQVGTDVTGPNSLSWSPTTRKSLITFVAQITPPAQAFLARLRHWIDTHTDQVIIIVSLVLGFWLVGNSIYYLIT